MKERPRLAVVESHPIQYHAPVYRALQQEFDISVTAVYGSDFSVVRYHDAEFGASFQWDTDLLSGYDARFLTRVSEGGAHTAEEATTRGLARQLREVKPAAVLLVGYSPRFHRDAYLAAWRGGFRMLFRGETTDHAVARSPFQTAARAVVLKGFYRRFAALLYVGAHSREHYRRLGIDSTRLFFSPYCVDATAFQPDALARATLRARTRAEFEIPMNGRVILFAGKLSPRKAPDTLLRAVKRFSALERAETTLLFVGDGELRAPLAAMADESPSVRAVFAGFQNQTQLSRFYHAADLMVLPSRSGETWGLVVNEALLHGIPCVVSNDVGCAPDLVIQKETGEVFRTDDIDDLERAIRVVGEWTGNEEIRAKCMRRVQMYSTRRAAQGIADGLAAALRVQ